MNSLQTIQKINEFIEKICIENDLFYERISINKKSDHVSLSITISEKLSGFSRFAIDYLEKADNLGLNKNWLNNVIDHNGRKLCITGFVKNRYKKPIQVFVINKNSFIYMHPDKVKSIWGNY